MEPRPYLRDDLEITEGGTPYTRGFIEETWQNTTGSPRRLLATVDGLYEECDGLRARIDERDAEAIELRKALATLQDLIDERGTLIAERNRDIISLRSEISNLKRNSFQHAGLPEDVQALREEAAAWKDQYAVLKSINTSNNAQYDHQAAEITKLAASRKKWRKRARRANAVGEHETHRTVVIYNSDEEMRARRLCGSLNDAIDSEEDTNP